MRRELSRLFRHSQLRRGKWEGAVKKKKNNLENFKRTYRKQGAVTQESL